MTLELTIPTIQLYPNRQRHCCSEPWTRLEAVAVAGAKRMKIAARSERRRRGRIGPMEDGTHQPPGISAV